MIIHDDVLSLELTDDLLRVQRLDESVQFDFSWPALRVSIDGELVALVAESAAMGDGTAIRQDFSGGGMHVSVSLHLSGNEWLRKRVRVRADSALSTPDFLETDRQLVPDESLRVCGYSASTPIMTSGSDEEGAGYMPGCGYPVIGQTIFFGLEHPAGFCCLEDESTVALRHHPTWVDGELSVVDEVIGIGADARALFAEYLDSIRLPPLGKPLLAMGTFWSDPYLGDREYAVSLDAFRRFFQAFEALGIRPDLLTLDAGWNERQSVFQSKEDVGGDAGLRELRGIAEAMGAQLSLWISHNGPMGVDTEFLAGEGMAVGEGPGAAYNAGEYGVMMDPAFEGMLRDRFVALIRDVGAVHFKIDWDNECATNPDFAERYPTRHHVRQASIDAMIRIAADMREALPGVVTRNGWWPSPWWLMHTSHLWLTHSGDSEFIALPSRTQRDSATTHRDYMYHCLLQRDQAAVPLDCFDNHEMPDATRNAFVEEPVSWMNAVWLSFLRGATYIPYTLMPESLETWQAESLRDVMAFCRHHAERIFVSRGRMCLGDPARGEVYAFVQPSAGQTWCVLRNPLPIPQKIVFDAEALHGGAVADALQFYPCFERLPTNGGVTFGPHEVRIVILSEQRFALPVEERFVACRESSGLSCRVPASSEGSLVAPLQLVAEFAGDAPTRSSLPNGVQYQW
ncbi:MAG: hypothetical protein KAI66_26025, partial [Lentisphaeria bacterium]|nr:hypothetical protein [Lentisphaeria bacterium]